jgi:hypothetical protein
VPVKLRTAKTRRPAFSAEVLALFLELEHMSERSQTFRDKSRRLARLLGLQSEWWGMQHVNDRSDRPCHPPSCVAYTDWHRVRAVRRQLLAAVAEQERAPARRSAEARLLS